MKKRKLAFLALPLLLATLASCNGQTPKPEDTTPTQETDDKKEGKDTPKEDEKDTEKENPADDPTEDPADDPTEEETEDPIVELETEYLSEGSGGGFMVELNFGRWFASNKRYDCTYTVKNSDKTITVVSTRPEFVTIERPKLGKTAFTLVTHAPGDSIIKIYDKDDVLVYRNVIHVRKGYNEEEIKKVMYDNDIYKGLKALGNYRLAINSYEPLQGTLRGNDDVEADLQVTFSATYSSYYEPWDMYRFNLTTESQNEGSQTKVNALYVSTTGDCINIYYVTGGNEYLLNQFFPGDMADPYNVHYE